MNFDEAPDFGSVRVPQHSMEAECSILGSLLLDNESWDRIGDIVTDQDFHRKEHRTIFAAIGGLIMANKSADTITVFEQLQKTGDADSVGGLPYINSLAQYVPSAANARRYAEIVRERSILRKLARAGGEINNDSFAADGKPIKDVLDEAERKIMEIGQENGKQDAGFQSMESIVVKVVDRVTELAENPDADRGIMSGFYDLDKMTSGFQPGDLVILAARPSMGKTGLALNIAEHVAMSLGLPVGVFSMEMGATQLGVRLIGTLGRIDQTHLRTGQLTDEEWPRFTEAIERLRGVSLDIDERGAQTVADVRSGARRLARQRGQLGLIVVDYIQLMAMSAKMSDENRATAIGEITSGLKALAKELGCPVLALSQLSRGVESRPDKRPMMSDLRESGAIEQDADTIMFIYRDEYYTKDACKEPGVAEVIISKQRNGPTGTVRLAWLPAITKFESLASQGYGS